MMLNRPVRHVVRHPVRHLHDARRHVGHLFMSKALLINKLSNIMFVRQVGFTHVGQDIGQLKSLDQKGFPLSVLYLLSISKRNRIERKTTPPKETRARRWTSDRRFA